MRCRSGSAPPSPRSLLVLLAALGLLTRLTQGGQLDHHRVGPEDLVRRRVGEPHHEHVRDVATREVHVVRAARSGRQDEHLFLRHTSLASSSASVFVFGFSYSSGSTTRSAASRARAFSADFFASWRTFFGMPSR